MQMPQELSNSSLAKASPFSSIASSEESAMSSQPITNNAVKRTNVKRITNGKHKRNVSSGPNKRPAFILKLWTMVNDPENEAYIQWTPDGESFKVLSKENFEKVVLPKYFKHSNYSSFVRQLNMYGWHKVQDISSGAMQSGDEIRQFKSPYFIRGREDLLDNIVRNKSSKGSDDEDESDIGRILDELDLIKSNQMEIASDLNRIRNDNQMLWRECYESRERHKTHAETFERILRFLASLYSNNQGKFVNDGMSPAQKQQRLLLPNLNELSNGQISELNSHNIPLSAIEELISHNSNSDKFSTPSKSSRISTISNDEMPRISSHISDSETPQSAETSPQSLWIGTPEETKPSYKPLDLINDSSLTSSAKKSNELQSYIMPYDSLGMPLQPENNIYTSPNPSALPSISSTPSAISSSPTFENAASPASLQKRSTKSNGTIAPSFSNKLSPALKSSSARPPVSSGSSSLPLSGQLGSSQSIPSDSLATLTPLISDALYNANKGLVNDNITANTLLNESHDIDNIIRNINYQGDSLQRIQDRIQQISPYKEDSTHLGSPPTDPTFDVDEFLMNSGSDLLDGSTDINDNSVTIPSLESFEVMGPPQKRKRVDDIAEET